MDDFYEEDEPLDEVVAAFERGRSGVTGRPATWDAEATGVELRGDSTGSMMPLQTRIEASGPARAMQSVGTTANPVEAGVAS